MTPFELVEFSGWLLLGSYVFLSVVASLFLGRFFEKYGP